MAEHRNVLTVMLADAQSTDGRPHNISDKKMFAAWSAAARKIERIFAGFSLRIFIMSELV
ncbi:hypothetical protein G9409_06525 [Chlorobium sp. BLA1]|uniref:hypothetical protein n=1 Tax=Candidatus Chlorobium masyuteum TaxID=2716876 RepID=UPI00141F7C5D|nr:hypothetical protein [Candidatus Chlorobium masyuteum]NHQ60249.1 hypothetical protein [Candidatus Chlorobium masyuteum]